MERLDYKPKVSPNGKLIAYIGYKDKVQTYQNEMINIMSLDGENISTLSSNIDSSINEFFWDSKSKGLYISYDVRGDTKISYLSLQKKNNKIARVSIKSINLNETIGRVSLTMPRDQT